MKRILLVIALGLGVAISARAAMQIVVSARLGGELTGLQNTDVTVPVAVDMSAAGGEKLGSYTARLTWDPAVLTITNYNTDTLGNFARPLLRTDSVAQGVLNFTAINPSGVAGLVTLAEFRFYVDQATSSPLALTFSEMSAAGTFTDLLPSLITAGATFCGAKGQWGDLDGDGASNSRDALAILSQVVGLGVDEEEFPDLSLGDVDGDAKVDSRDALIVLSYAVGLDIPGQRVLLLAPQGCGTGSPRQATVFPAAAELAPNQELQLEARGTDAQGRAVSIPGAIWRSSDYGVATVDARGVVSPRASGLAVITAQVAPGIQAQAAITVVGRRANWYVDIRASNAPVQLGTVAYPFDHPTKAYRLIAEGDTIRVASGTYTFDDHGELAVGAVILGGTVGDTTTRPVFQDIGALDAPPVRQETAPARAPAAGLSGGSNTAFWLQGGFRTVVRNVVLKNFDTAVEIDGVRNFVLEDSKILVEGGVYGTGIYSCANGVIDTIRVDRSVLIGDSTGYAFDNDYCVERTAYFLVRDSKVLRWGGGIYWTDADSLAVIRSEVSENDGEGIYTAQEYDVEPSVYVAHSRIERNYYEAVYADYSRRLVIDTSVIRTTEDDGIGVYGPSSLAQVYLHGDSIFQEGNAEDYAWLDSDDVDSLIIDHTVVRYPADTNFYAYTYVYADKAFVTYSKFLNIGGSGSEPFYFNGSEAFVDSVEMSGCNVAGCDQGYGLELYAYNSSLRATVQRSRFNRLEYAVYAGSVSGTHTITGLVMDSVGEAIEIGGDTAYVANNTLTRVWSTGIDAGGSASSRGPTSIRGNSISCTGTGAIGIGLYTSQVYLVTADTVSGCYTGVDAGTFGTGSAIRGGALRNDSIGVRATYGGGVLLLVDSVGISGSSIAAVQASAGPVTLTRSRIENNAQFGFWISSGSSTHQANGNSFVGNLSSAISAYLSVPSVDATNNWWGADADPGVGVGVANGVDGNVTYLPRLNSPPVVPGLAPPAVAVRGSPALSAPARVVQPARAIVRGAHPEKRARTRPALRSPAGASPERVARIQQGSDRQAAHESRQADRERQRDSSRAAARAANAAARLSEAPGR